MAGARAVHKAILQDFPQADISVSIIWTNMLPLDSPATARLSAEIIHDPRASQFYDPDHLAGKAIAEGMGGKDKIAWDIYLFYAAGAEWGDHPPAPTDWAHQLTGSAWADSTRHHSGDELLKELHRIMQRLLQIG